LENYKKGLSIIGKLRKIMVVVVEHIAHYTRMVGAHFGLVCFTFLFVFVGHHVSALGRWSDIGSNMD